MMIGTVQTPYGAANIKVGRYRAGNAIYVQLICEDGEAVTTFSTNLRPYGGQVEQDEFHVRGWAENEELVDPMMKTGLFVDTGKRAELGHVIAPVWKMVSMAHVPA